MNKTMRETLLDYRGADVITDERLAELAEFFSTAAPFRDALRIDNSISSDIAQFLRELQQLRKREYYCRACGIRKEAGMPVDVDF